MCDSLSLCLSLLCLSLSLCVCAGLVWLESLSQFRTQEAIKQPSKPTSKLTLVLVHVDFCFGFILACCWFEQTHAGSHADKKKGECLSFTHWWHGETKSCVSTRKAAATSPLSPSPSSTKSPPSPATSELLSTTSEWVQVILLLPISSSFLKACWLCISFFFFSSSKIYSSAHLSTTS